jgi:hypothetical protein
MGRMGPGLRREDKKNQTGRWKILEAPMPLASIQFSIILLIAHLVAGPTG